MIVLHYTAMADFGAALDRLCDPAAEVSAHYAIGRDGALVQMVDEAMRAWHAGSGGWGACADINSVSIGIELDNSGQEPFSAPLMTTLERLLDRLMSRHAIPPERVLGHSDTAPGRKADPGPRFDWRRLARGGLAAWPAAGGEAAGELGAALARIGYRAPSAEAALAAFRLRFRPWAGGPADATDRAMAADLAARFPAR